ncbi:MAG: hypothetical protein K2X55_02295, partial [Burkholderiaceae bacterium]|nr:hypothetical protein [Burkholderiaceae bacterium]
AVAPHYRHTMTPKGAWPGEGQVQAIYDAELAAAHRDVDRMVKTGELGVKYATAEIHHLAWVRAATKLGLIYTREAS